MCLFQSGFQQKENFLYGNYYSLIDAATVNSMADIWEMCADDLKEADRRLLEACGIEKGFNPATDERVQKVLCVVIDYAVLCHGDPGSIRIGILHCAL